MSIKSTVVDTKAKTITIVMDLETPTPSKSGKTMVVASSRGNQPTTGQVDGQVIIAGINMYIKA